MTYQQAYNKIIEGYFKDEIKPMEPKFCFCGTLSPDENWGLQPWIQYPYSVKEYRKMETALMSNLGAILFDTNLPGSWACGSEKPHQPDYEDRLFNGMCAALEILKEIHRERGEDVDGVPEFTKRQLTISHKQ